MLTFSLLFVFRAFSIYAWRFHTFLLAHGQLRHIKSVSLGWVDSSLHFVPIMLVWHLKKLSINVLFYVSLSSELILLVLVLFSSQTPNLNLPVVIVKRLKMPFKQNPIVYQFLNYLLLRLDKNLRGNLSDFLPNRSWKIEGKNFSNHSVSFEAIWPWLSFNHITDW